MSELISKWNDNRQVNNFLVNQEVNARMNFYCLSKFAQLKFTNNNSVTAKLQFAQLRFALL